MDPWNPVVAEHHVKRVPFWQALCAGLFLLLSVIAAGWVAAVLLLSLERAS